MEERFSVLPTAAAATDEAAAAATDEAAAAATDEAAAASADHHLRNAGLSHDR
jgi:hypothetical protein